MASYNTTKIENWYNDFVRYKNKFNNEYYADYTSSYIKTNYNDVNSKIKTSLDKNYNKIKDLYKSIDTYWKNLIDDIKNADAVMAGNQKSGSIHSSSVVSTLNSLPELEEYEVTLDTRFASASATVGTQKNVQWIEDNLSWERIGATVSTFGVSLLEGVVNITEAAVDLVEITGAAISSLFTGVIDLVNLASAEITGDESKKTNYTKELWDETRAVVSEDISATIFDSFYENTEAGKWMKENCYGFEVTRAIGGEVAEVAAVVALSTVTGGSAAVIYGTLKAGEHIEENWQDESKSTAEGLLGGMLEGAADGAFFALGQKGDQLTKSVVKSFAKEGEKQILKKSAVLLGKMVYEGITSVAQDGTNMLLDTLFMDNTVVDANGNKIVFDSYMDKLNYSYEQAGSKDAFVESLITAMLLSGVSDVSDVFGKAKNIDVDNAARNIEIDTDNTLNVTKNSNIEAKSVLSKEQKTNMWIEYNDKLDKWGDDFDYYKELYYNNGAGDLNKIEQFHQDFKRIIEIEDNLGLTGTKSSVTKEPLKWSSIDKDNADIIAKEINQKPIPAMEKYNIDTNSKEYKDAMREIYSKPNAKGTQILSQDNNPFNNINSQSSKQVNNSAYVTAKTINDNLSKQAGFYRTMAGFFASIPATFSKMKNVDITENSKIFNKIKNEGLYHFTDEVSAQKILESGYIKESSHFTSYGKKRTFLFAGIPSVDEACLNSVFDYKKTAVKLHPSDTEITGLQYRKYSDSAVSSIGNYDITKSSPEITYLVLKEQDGVLKYTEVSKLEYDNYNPNFSDSAMKKSIENTRKKLYQTTVGMASEYDNVKNGIKLFKEDLSDKFYRMTKSNISNNSTENFYFSDDSMKNMNIKRSNVAASDLYISKSRIIEYEKAFGLNYTSDAHDKKIINIFETLSKNSSNIPDENVAKIVRNIDSISKVEKRFRIGEWHGTSAFGFNSVNMDSKLLDCSEDVINTVLMHEFGHAYYHIFNGDASNNYNITLSDSKKQVIINTQKMLSENPEIYIDILRESQTCYYDAVSETIKWYDIQRSQENVKIRDMVEKMYIENGIDSLSKMVDNAKKMEQVNEILANVGMESAEVSEILSNKELTTQILQAQNNISNQNAHFDEIMSSYSGKADYRKLSSTINSITQKTEHIDPVTNEKVYCTYSHSDSYWSSISQEDSYRRTYDELVADYFSLASNGRIEVLNKMEKMFGSELMDSIKGEFKLIVDELDKRGLLTN